MTALTVSDVRLTDRKSFPAWYAELKINSTFRNVWPLVDPEAPDAPHLLSAEPALPPSINSMIKQRNKELRAPQEKWDADERAEREKGPRPQDGRAAKFDDIKEEYSMRLKGYSIEQANWAARSSRYQNIWDWVRRTVEPRLLAPTLELLVEEGKLSLQNVVRALCVKFQASEDNMKEQAREEYKQVLEQGKTGSIAPKAWIDGWYAALARAQTLEVAEVEGFLAVKDFLQVVGAKLLPAWGTQQLAMALEAHALREPVRTLEQYGRIFEALIEQVEHNNTRLSVFATFGGQRSGNTGSMCPCKENRSERHPWPSHECSIVELAVTGSTSRQLDPYPTEAQLKAVRDRLSTQGFNKLREQLERKGWTRKSTEYPGNINA